MTSLLEAFILFNINFRESHFPVFIYKPGHNILELHNALVQVQFSTSKTKLESSHELPNDLRLKKLGNIRKILNLSREPSIQSPFQKLNVGNSSQNGNKSRY